MHDALIHDLLETAARIARGEVPPYMHNEFTTAGAFDLLLMHMETQQAFNVLEELCNRYSVVRATHPNLTGYFFLLASLATNSQTTELPIGMREIIEENPEMAEDLRRWYRVSL